MTTTDAGITCRDTTHLVCDARDVPMRPEQYRQLQAHLATCTACQTASRQFEQLFGQLDVLFARDSK